MSKHKDDGIQALTHTGLLENQLGNHLFCTPWETYLLPH